MLDHDNCGALGNEAVKHTQQHLNIERMQANRGLVEHEYGIILHAAHLARKLKTLSLAARERRCGLAKCEITQTQVVQGLQARLNLLESQCGVDGSSTLISMSCGNVSRLPSLPSRWICEAASA